MLIIIFASLLLPLKVATVCPQLHLTEPVRVVFDGPPTARKTESGPG